MQADFFCDLSRKLFGVAGCGCATASQSGAPSVPARAGLTPELEPGMSDLELVELDEILGLVAAAEKSRLFRRH
jgi:hypothetical protein